MDPSSQTPHQVPPPDQTPPPQAPPSPYQAPPQPGQVPSSYQTPQSPPPVSPYQAPMPVGQTPPPQMPTPAGQTPLPPQAPMPVGQTPPPYQQPPSRRGLSTGAIVGIALGSLALIAVIGIIAALVTHVVTSRSGTNPLDEFASSSKSSSAKLRPTKAYHNSHIYFNYPDTLTQKDSSNVTIVTPDGSPSDYQVFRVEGDPTNTDAIINYRGWWSDNPVTIDKSRRLSAMKQSVEAQKNINISDVIEFRSTIAHGCVSDFVYTIQPTLVEQGEIIGMKYGFTCKSYFGDVQGEYFVWYDTYGSKHALTVDALKDYWNKNQADLQAVIESVALQST